MKHHPKHCHTSQSSSESVGLSFYKFMWMWCHYNVHKKNCQIKWKKPHNRTTGTNFFYIPNLKSKVILVKGVNCKTSEKKPLPFKHIQTLSDSCQLLRVSKRFKRGWHQSPRVSPLGTCRGKGNGKENIFFTTEASYTLSITYSTRNKANSLGWFSCSDPITCV